MFRVIAIVLLICSSFAAAGQSNFLKTYNYIGYQSGKSMIEDADHNYIIVGGGQNDASGQLRIFIAKTDVDGEILWTRYITPSQYAFAEQVLDSPDGYVVLGNAIPLGAYLGLLDKDGNVTSSVIFNDSIWSAKAMDHSGGALIITGEMVQKNNIYLHDIMLLKTDISGNTKWVKKIGTFAEDERPFKILSVKEGGCMLVGITTENNEYPFYENILILRIDEDGDVIWKKVMGGIEQNVPYDLIRTSDGNFVFISFNSGNHGILNVTKIDLNGTVLWDKPINGAMYGAPHSIVELPNGKLLVTGEKITYFNLPPEPPRWVLLWELSQAGDLTGQKEFQIGTSSAGNVVMNTHDSSLILTGVLSNGVDSDFFLLKIGTDLCLMNSPELGADIVSCKSPVALNAGRNHPNYYWSTGAITQSISVTESGKYFVGVSKDGCIRSDTVNVHIEECETFANCIGSHEPPFNTIIPNVVTDDNHSANSYFVIPEIIAGSKLVVFNRWGSIVYSNEHYDNSWSGADLSSGVYFYVLSNECLDKNIKGAVRIIR